ncbi:MAG TPA: 1-acyl-sn-glycerol-3-phosphate acyltransferase [Leptospiraceae bacterium]|nr:1-acyl-sn-glycerol-3-phosphate acyltransferase [Leptospiraceae bacterium]HNF16052.1 1-acyl-sn-glycerol-3-phosphate acyltransferase [Leptospiraceae bacterium]HNF26238.1 1-acyl-sn-glycerol-3-phosphate acyltransferase [Leptospiraceae bacterium]HNI94555.1 1-acyl-sn-glycerol-3-phosphate acyltransferase [Leptospiraceae bacterium]HNM05983.1 1-acyl-sn-glycerol-3-phosphate acyltransferase [Leptospiraceae bacterium]
MKEILSEGIPDFIKENQKIYYEYFDPDFADAILRNVISVLDEYYFRTKFIAPEKLHERNNPERPIIYAGNHSGMAFPWDAIIFVANLYKKNANKFQNSVRALSAPMLSASALMSPFLIENFWKRVGCIDATMENFETMMHQKDWNVLIYPEGVPGIAKGFNNRYKLQQFSTSFLRMSIKYQTDIVFVATVNAEYINPYSYNSRALDKIVQVAGIPFIPVSALTPFIIFQPWLFYFGFPANLTYVVGPRIKPYEMLPKPLEKIRKPELRELRDEVQRQFQVFLDDSVEKYGKDPYDGMEYLKTNLKNLNKVPYISPSGWPVLFAEFERRYKKEGNKMELPIGFFDYIKAAFKNPMAASFYLPILGLIPILMKGYKGNHLDDLKKKHEH